MPKIRELLHFEKIKDVIDIDRDVKAQDNRKNLVSEYVISRSIEDHLVHFFKNLQQPKHKSLQIVGGYGSGKSHLLAFIYSVLHDPSLTDLIQNEKVKEEAKKVNRKFVIVRTELQAGKADLSEYFFDRVTLKLEEEYGITIHLSEKNTADYKDQIQTILQTIKEKDPTTGFIVIFDEVSDFLKSKPREAIHRDMQFLRILAQESMDSDFVFIGAMQEQVFSNPKYMDEAESFGRIAERFNVITIEKEEIEKVLSQRIVKKSKEQRIELEKLLKPFKDIYPLLSSQIDKFIDLFPLHPYVIDVFNNLPYFEKRGVLQFAIQQIEKILDEDFPRFITYHEIFDEINARHTIRNYESVKPVLNAIEILNNKLDLLEQKYKGTAHKIIKALAIQHLLGSTISKQNGANVEELANTLLLTPVNKAFTVQDEIDLIIKKLKEVTDGQFIAKTHDNVYFIDLNLTIDYESIVSRKMQNLPESTPDQVLARFIAEQLNLKQEITMNTYADTMNWKSRKSFRNGLFFYHTGKQNKPVLTEEHEFLLQVCSPFYQEMTSSLPNEIILHWKLTDKAKELVFRSAALQILIQESQYRAIMEEKLRKMQMEFRDAVMESVINTGALSVNNEKKQINAIMTLQPNNFEELFSQAKSVLLEQYFTQRYPEHPSFVTMLSAQNLQEELNRATKEVLKFESKEFTSNTKSILTGFHLINSRGYIDIQDSSVAKSILETVKTKVNEMIPLPAFTEAFHHPPYGYTQDMTYFIIMVLVYLGQVEGKMSNKTINASNIQEFLSQGIASMSNVKYLTQSTQELDKIKIKKLFEILGLPAKIIQDFTQKNEIQEVLQEFQKKVISIKEKIAIIETNIQKIQRESSSLLNNPDFIQHLKGYELLPLSDWASITKPVDIKKLEYTQEKLDKIAESVEKTEKIVKLAENIIDSFLTKFHHIQKIKQVIEKNTNLFLGHDLPSKITETEKLLEQTNQLFEKDLWNQVIGKMEQIEREYGQLYYTLHEETVGNKVNWSLIQEINQNSSFQKLRILKMIDSAMDTSQYYDIENQLSSFSHLKCLDFNMDMLQEEAICSKCQFPVSDKPYVDIHQWYENTMESIEQILSSWEKTIIKELKEFQKNLELVSPKNQLTIQGMIESGLLPEVIDQSLVKDINEMLKEIVSININPAELAKAIFQENAVLTYIDFENRLKAYQQKITQGFDLTKVRMKLIQTHKEE